MNKELEELKELVKVFGLLNIKEKNGPTFLAIAKCPQLENVWSNILAFYFNPNNEHKLYELVLKSLFEAATIDFQIINNSDIESYTEQITELGNRIDIIVEGSNFVLGIENKVNAALYNDLSDYSKTVDALAKNSKVTYKIILSKYKNNSSNGFINVTYFDFISRIKLNLGDYTSNANTKYLTFLIDFISNIEVTINAKSMKDNPEVVSFFYTNLDRINKLLSYSNEISNELINKLDSIRSLIPNGQFNSKLIEIEKQTGKKTTFKDFGVFTYKGQRFLKYGIVIGNIPIFFQLGLENYKIKTCYWIDDFKYKSLIPVLEANGLHESLFDYNIDASDIALDTEKQLEIIIATLEHS